MIVTHLHASTPPVDVDCPGEVLEDSFPGIRRSADERIEDLEERRL